MTASNPVATSPALSARPRILLAEDAIDSREMLTEVLETLGYLVVIAKSVLESEPSA